MLLSVFFLCNCFFTWLVLSSMCVFMWLCIAVYMEVCLPTLFVSDEGLGPETIKISRVHFLVCGHIVYFSRNVSYLAKSQWPFSNAFEKVIFSLTHTHMRSSTNLTNCAPKHCIMSFCFFASSLFPNLTRNTAVCRTAAPRN